MLNSVVEAKSHMSSVSNLCPKLKNKKIKKNEFHSDFSRPRFQNILDKK